jgi:hypothetical protein
VFCDAPDERVLQSCPTVSSDDEINLRVACRGDFVDRGTRRRSASTTDRAKIHLFERVHFCQAVSSTASASGQTDAGAVNERSSYMDTSRGTGAA